MSATTSRSASGSGGCTVKALQTLHLQQLRQGRRADGSGGQHLHTAHTPAEQLLQSLCAGRSRSARAEYAQQSVGAQPAQRSPLFRRSELIPGAVKDQGHALGCIAESLPGLAVNLAAWGQGPAGRCACSRFPGQADASAHQADLGRTVAEVSGPGSHQHHSGQRCAAGHFHPGLIGRQTAQRKRTANFHAAGPTLQGGQQ